VFSYCSFSGGISYTFDVVYDSNGLITIQNLQGPIASTAACSTACSTNIPEDVLEDMQDAKGLVELLLSETEVASGTLTFTGQTQQTAAIPAGVLNNTNYRVAYTDPCGTLITTENKTLLTFDAVVGVAYGTLADPIDVEYSVLVSTAQNSSFGGSVTFVVADAGQIVVSFPQAVPTTAYRVLLSPEGFFVPRVINKTLTSFTIELGHGLTGAETATVGFDVFV
jgi:hypothetical protein